MPGNAAALTTLAAVLAELGLTGTIDAARDAYLTTLIDRYSAKFATLCNRSFYFDPAVVEYLPGYGNTRLVLKRTPIVSVASLVYDGGTIDPVDYMIENANAGFLYARYGFRNTAARQGGSITGDIWPGTEAPVYVCTYAGGYVTPQQATDGVTGGPPLPPDIELAIIEAAVRDRAIAGSG